jgi:hypothetical protein
MRSKQIEKAQGIYIISSISGLWRPPLSYINIIARYDKEGELVVDRVERERE